MRQDLYFRSRHASPANDGTTFALGQGAMNTRTRCPFLKEVVMLYCDACPSKKLLPRNQVSSVGRCATSEFESCPLFREIARGVEPSVRASGPKDNKQGKERRP